MSGVYVAVEVRLHRLDQNAKALKTPEEVRTFVDQCVRTMYDPDYDGDVEVELIESAGFES